jgi:pimeloyl-ACP methyl ester carboxylesterase
MDFPTDPDSFFVSPHGRIHYRSLSLDGAPHICILPGFTIPSSLYVPIARFLHSEGYSISIIDYWGRGFSDSRDDSNYSLDSHISILPLFLAHLQLTKSSFIGFSYGAAVLAGFSSKHLSLLQKWFSCHHFTSPWKPQIHSKGWLLDFRTLDPQFDRSPAAGEVNLVGKLNHPQIVRFLSCSINSEQLNYSFIRRSRALRRGRARNRTRLRRSPP